MYKICIAFKITIQCSCVFLKAPRNSEKVTFSFRKEISYHIFFTGPIITDLENVYSEVIQSLDDGKCKDRFIQTSENLLLIPMEFLSQLRMSRTYSEVAFSGCKKLCLELHDEICSRIFFFPKIRSCILTPKTGKAVTNTSNQTVHAAAVFERQRCPGRNPT